MDYEKLKIKYNFYPLNGSVPKITASVVYGAYKRKEVEVLPEFIKYLYDAVDNYPRSRGIAQQRYNQDFSFYDKLYQLTVALLDKNRKEGQELIDYCQDYLIKRSSKKSPFFKYLQKSGQDGIEELKAILDSAGWEEAYSGKNSLGYNSPDNSIGIGADSRYGVEMEDNDSGDVFWKGSFEEFFDEVRLKNSHVFVRGDKLR